MHAGSFEPSARIGSFATLDFQLSYRWTDQSTTALLRNLRITLSAQNIFDRDPPSVYGNSSGRGTVPLWAEGASQGRMGGTPWQFRNRYIENSPSWDLDRVHTPLLLLHGATNQSVPVWESTLIFNALKRLGREAEYVQYPNEGHPLTARADRQDAYERVVAWFDEHLKGAEPN